MNTPLLIVLLTCAATLLGTSDNEARAQPAQQAGSPGKRLLGVLQGSSGQTASFSQDGKRILTAGGRDVRLWQTDTLKPVTAAFDHGDQVRKAVLSPNANFILSVGGREGRLWDVATGKPLILTHKATAIDGAFSPDGKCVVTSGDEVKVWDCATGKLLRTLEHEDYVPVVCFSPQGDTILTVCNTRNGSAYLWDATTGKRLLGPLSEAHLPGYWDDNRNIGSVAFSSDGKRIATIDFLSVAVWDKKTGEKQMSIDARTKGQAGTTKSIAFTPDSSKLVVSDSLGYINTYDAETGKMLSEIQCLYPQYTICTPDGKQILASSRGGDSGMWDIRTGKRLLWLNPDEGKGADKDDIVVDPTIALDPQGLRIAAGWSKSNFTLIWEISK